MTIYSEKMAIARKIVLTRTPYISTTLLSLVPYEVEGLGMVMTTAKLVMLYDPVWFESLPDEEAAAALFHETQHPLRSHGERSIGFANKYLFNVAGDITINDDARYCGYTIGKDWYVPETLGVPTGMSAEEYYDILSQEEEEKPQPGSGGPPCSGNCGSAAGNGTIDEEKYEKEVEAESPGATKSPIEVKAIMRAQAKEINDYVASSSRGKVPNHLVEWAKFALKPPKVLWRRQLPRVIRRVFGRLQAGGENYSRARPSKRSFIRGYVIPGIVSYKPELAFVRDTSGSMGRQQLEDAQNEAVGALKAAGVETVWFMDADAAAGKPRRVGVKDIPKLPITGRGGTDFGPALEAISKLKPRPKAVFYFTDGDGGAPSKPPPGIDVIWVVVKSHWNKPPAPWGRCIFVDD